MEKVYEELEEAKTEIERLKSNLNNKESIIKQLSSANESLREDYKQKLKKSEEENRQLLMSLDESNDKGRENQQKLSVLTEEVETLKSLVSFLQKKCSEAEKAANSPKEKLWGRDDLLQELEEKQKILEDELKWKVEQFKHLEEAHEKLLDKFRVSESEWEKEKSSLIDEISKLQDKLDNGEKTAESLRNRLDMCKQALDHEEIRRKRVESQVSELRSQLENASSENFEGKYAEIDDNEEVVNLRHLLRVKEMEYKDIEYKARELEKENQELLTSIKDLQEAQIPKIATPPSSLAKLRSKLKSLEQTHKDCSANFRAKEAEWSSQAQKMTQELKIKDEVIEELKKDLEGSNSSLTQLKMQNEELSLMSQLMESEFSESKVGEKERKLMEELQEVYGVLERVDFELTEKTNEGSELEFELQSWKSIAERLKMQLEESQEMRRELEISLLAQAEVEEILKTDAQEKDKRISDLEEKIILFNQKNNDDQLEQELLARELEEVVVQGFDHGGNDVYTAKENVNRQNYCTTKMVEFIIEERSPFREVN